MLGPSAAALRSSSAAQAALISALAASLGVSVSSISITSISDATNLRMQLRRSLAAGSVLIQYLIISASKEASDALKASIDIAPGVLAAALDASVAAAVNTDSSLASVLGALTTSSSVATATVYLVSPSPVPAAPSGMSAAVAAGIAAGVAGLVGLACAGAAVYYCRNRPPAPPRSQPPEHERVGSTPRPPLYPSRLKRMQPPPLPKLV